MEEDISPEAHHIREMYAIYGAAMYHGQVLEAGVKQALLVARMVDKQIATSADFDAASAKQFKLVLGRLVEQLRPFLASDTSLDGRLQLALSIRNELAHHFFWDHAADAVEEEGRELMMDRCRRAIDLFEEVSSELAQVVKRFSDEAGIAQKMSRGKIDDEASRLSAERARTRGTRCGRCGGTLVELADHGWSSTRCVTCGAVALI